MTIPEASDFSEVLSKGFPTDSGFSEGGGGAVVRDLKRARGVLTG